MLKNTTETLEINSILTSVVGEKGAFTVWQRGSDNSLLSESAATLTFLDMEGDCVNFEVSEPFAFDPNFPVFFAVKGKKIVFKLPTLTLKDALLECMLPSEMKYEERRKHSRKKVRRGETKEIELIFKLKDCSDEVEDETIISRLVDYSQGGACFVISKETLSRVDLTSKIDIRSLASDIILSSTKGLIVNTRRHKGATLGHEELFSIGVMFI